MNCNSCGNTTCTCEPQLPAGQPGRPGDPGPPTTITIGVDILPAGDAPTVIPTGAPPLQHFQLGIPAAPSPVFDPVVDVTQLNPGDPATAAIDNTDPLNPILELGLAPGEDGADGVSPFTSLTLNFQQPGPGTAAFLITVGDASWMTPGAWLYIEGGGHYYCSSGPVGTNQVYIVNPGASILYLYGWAIGNIPTNLPSGNFILTTGSPAQVKPAGVPGVAGQNIVGAAGTQDFFGSANPNSSPPSGSNIGDVYWRTAGGTLTYYRRTGVSTWTVLGTVALLGTATTVDTHTGGGIYAFDAAVFSYILSTDSDIDLEADTTNYDGAGTWMFSIYNSDGVSHDLDVGGNSQSGIPTLPLTIGPGLTANVVMRRFTENGTTFAAAPKFVIELAYIVS